MPLERSPSGRHSPNYLAHDLNQVQERKSPTRSTSGLGFAQNFANLPVNPLDRRSSPSKEMVIQSWNERQKSPTLSIHFTDRKSPVLTGPNTGAFFLEPRRSPINQLPIPPITISNPSETCGLSPKSIDSPRMSSPKEQSPIKEQNADKSGEKKEKTSVMREILAFVRKPSKKVTTRTSRFAAVFSKSNNDSNAPLARQSTFSSMPSSTSCAGRAAVTKQMSYEPKISSKLKSVGSKMSLRLRRATDSKKDSKKSNGDDVSDHEKIVDEISDMESGGTQIDFDSIYFEKMCHKKHELIVEEEDSIEKVNEEASSSSKNELDKPRNLYEELKKSIETLFENKDPIYENIDEYRHDKSQSIDMDGQVMLRRSNIQCPTFEIEPPSRRASFDPPRSPFLENFRSLSDTDHTDIPSGESFEVVDTHHRESSFEDRSMDTSFDISRYQSTSYEDQTSSFEIVETHESQTPQPQNILPSAVKEDLLKTSNIDLSKSAIEIVDPETFLKSSPAAGRKSSLETHFDLSENYSQGNKSSFTPNTTGLGKSRECFPIGMKAAHQASLLHHHHHPSQRTKSPVLSNQNSSNYSSRDSYDTSTCDSFPPQNAHSHSMPQNITTEPRNPYSDPSKHHYPLPRKYSYDKGFICLDKRCTSIFEPRPSVSSNTTNQLLNTTDTSSGSEFEAPSPRRALSASPKHTFTFRIVMKKVESSPEDLCFSNACERQNKRNQRERQSRRKSRLHDNKGKSF
jgi:hypothetical protein